MFQIIAKKRYTPQIWLIYSHKLNPCKANVTCASKAHIIYTLQTQKQNKNKTQKHERKCQVCWQKKAEMKQKGRCVSSNLPNGTRDSRIVKCFNGSRTSIKVVACWNLKNFLCVPVLIGNREYDLYHFLVSASR